MKVCVYGLWHLGSVTAACLADAGFHVVGLDADVAALRQGTPPVAEPGLAELIRKGLSAGRLHFADDAATALGGADVVWVAFDTPVDEEDRADVELVLRRVESIFPWLENEALLLVSSQLPVGSTGRLREAWNAVSRGRRVHLACAPENLRLGRALEAFRRPARVIVGTAPEAPRDRITQLFHPFCTNILWMSVESAEMTKHALNAFLATSVAFMNALATLCEVVGADAKEVEQGLKSEPRIGPGAYLAPGAAFAGGTLARDIAYLEDLGLRYQVPASLFSAVRTGNDLHKDWPRRTLQRRLGDLAGRTVAVLGLTYKPGTDTLRRSAAVELCRWLHTQGARVRAYDPAVRTLPADLEGCITLTTGAVEAASGAAALVIETGWPEFRQIDGAALVRKMQTPLVIDAGRFLAGAFEHVPGVQYATVGKP